jgi:hypothetical protein
LTFCCAVLDLESGSLTAQPPGLAHILYSRSGELTAGTCCILFTVLCCVVLFVCRAGAQEAAGMRALRTWIFDSRRDWRKGPYCMRCVHSATAAV